MGSGRHEHNIKNWAGLIFYDIVINNSLHAVILHKINLHSSETFLKEIRLFFSHLVRINLQYHDCFIVEVSYTWEAQIPIDKDPANFVFIFFLLQSIKLTNVFRSNVAF